MIILFLADGSSKIGMGHVYRSINLANELKNDYEIIFITREKISFKFFKKYFKCFFIDRKDITKEKKILEKIKPDLVIIDKLKERNITINNINRICSNILSIDYTKNNIQKIKHGITMLYPYSAFSSQNTTLKYTIIDKKFRKNKISNLRKTVKKIIILQGGSDTYCFTPNIVKSFNSVPFDVQLTVITGPSFNCWKQLNDSINSSTKKIRVLHNVKNMPGILKNYDLAITAGGMTLLELACVGLPSLIICGERFEIETAKLLEKYGFGKNLGFGKNVSTKKLNSEISAIINDFNTRKSMKLCGQNLIDGNGVFRAKKLVQSLII